MAITDRMIRATRGEVDLYEEVEHDTNATGEAFGVVAIVALASGIGGAAGLATSTARHGNPAVGIIAGIIAAVVAWAVFSGVAYFIGTRMFNADATWEEVLRTLGYAYSPQVVNIISFVPFIGGLLSFVAFLWSMYLSFIALRSALDITGGQTL